jgi:hypothetical protein
MESTTPEVRLVVDAITGSVLCCNCLGLRTGLTDVVVRQSLITASRTVRLNTWTPCHSCGAVEETYGIALSSTGFPLRHYSSR